MERDLLVGSFSMDMNYCTAVNFLKFCVSVFVQKRTSGYYMSRLQIFPNDEVYFVVRLGAGLLFLFDGSHLTKATRRTLG